MRIVIIRSMLGHGKYMKLLNLAPEEKHQNVSKKNTKGNTYESEAMVWCDSTISFRSQHNVRERFTTQAAMHYL